MKTLHFASLILCCMKVYSEVMSERYGCTTTSKHIEKFIYTESGNFSFLNCSVDISAIPMMDIESIRWTNGTDNTFISQIYGGGLVINRHERMYIENSSMTTLIINDTQVTDEGVYKCRVRSNDTPPSDQTYILKLIVYDNFSLEINTGRSICGDTRRKFSSIVNAALGLPLTINCTAFCSRPRVNLTWTFNTTAVNHTLLTKSIATFGANDAITSELSLEKVNRQDMGEFYCIAYYIACNIHIVKIISVNVNISVSQDVPSSHGNNVKAIVIGFTITAVAVTASVFITVFIFKCHRKNETPKKGTASVNDNSPASVPLNPKTQSEGDKPTNGKDAADTMV